MKNLQGARQREENKGFFPLAENPKENRKKTDSESTEEIPSYYLYGQKQVADHAIPAMLKNKGSGTQVLGWVPEAESRGRGSVKKPGIYRTKDTEGKWKSGANYGKTAVLQ